MLERMIDSTSSFNNIYGFANNNSNSYRGMMMDTIWMNHVYSGEILCNIFLDEESNVDKQGFLNFWKIIINHYEMGA